MKLKFDCDLEELVKAFEAAPEKVRQMVRVQMKMAARDIKEHAATHHRYKTRSGNMERSGVETAVEDSRAEIFLSPAVPYGVFLHEGTKAHNIVPRSKKALRWVNGNEFIFAKKVRHPGIKADPFLYSAAEKELPKIEKRFQIALDNLAEGL